MTKRDRLEDLGRLQEKIRQICDSDLMEILDRISCRRPKDFEQVFNEMSDERKSDLLHEIAYGLETVSSMLADCYCIAAGLDGDS